MLSNWDVTKDVTTPEEYKEAVEAAETLGLELAWVDAYGYGWETPTDAPPVQPNAAGHEVDIVKVGRKYFHMKLANPGEEPETIPVACGSSAKSLDDAVLKMRFTKQ